MDLLLLGSVEATMEGRPVRLGARKQRAVLAMLALHPNETVSVDQLVDGLWGDEPPATAAKMVQLYVSQLRRLLGDDDAQILTHGRGYELRMPADGVDVARFEALVAEAARPDGRPPGDAARRALALWRGAALADVAGEPFAATEISRLEELRLEASELAIDADLACGRHCEVIGELDGLVAQHPLSERLHAQRMLALYRAGRQGDALEAYRRARDRLVEQVGIEPGPELRELHDAVLHQDPSLTLPRGARPPPPRPPPSGSAPGAHRRPWPPGRRLLAAAAALVVLCAGAALMLDRGDASKGLGRIAGNTVGLIDPGDLHITEQYGVGRGPRAVVAGAGSIWVANATDNTVTRIERGHAPRVAIPVGTEPGGLAFAAGSLWVATPRDRRVAQVVPAANAVARRIDVGNRPSAIVAGYGSIWVTSEVDRTVTRIDLARGFATEPIHLGANPSAIAAGAGAIWVTSEEGGALFRIDPVSARVTRTMKVGNAPASVAVGEHAVWVVNRQDGTVWRIDPVTVTLTDTIAVGRAPVAIATGAQAVWVANSGDGTVSRIDGAHPRAAPRAIDVDSSPSALAVIDGAVWTAARHPARAHRGGTLRVQMPAGIEVDRGAYDASTARLTSSVYDGLVTYRRLDGEAFGPLVADLATAVPEPSPDGKAYVFTLRPGVRYSTGRPVEPEDVRASLEGLLRVHGATLPSFYDHIIGARACRLRPAACDLSQGIVTKPGSQTVTIRLTDPDPELLPKLTLPFAYIVPAGWPYHPRRPPPGTGPYRFESFRFNRGARLVRNPYFRVWSNDARPDGIVDRIDIAFSKDINAQVAAVERGAADVVAVADVFGGPLAPARLRALANRSADRLYTYAEPEIDTMFLNMRRPPFDEVRVRQAVNYAVDRHRIARAAGGPDLAQSTCQFATPGSPGYTPMCRYTVDPGPGGSWTAPDLDRARRLIRRSRTRGMHVTVWGEKDKWALVSYIGALLRTLGYRTSFRWYPDFPTLNAHTADSRTGAQIGILGWTADYGTPSTFALPYLCSSFRPRSTSNTNNGHFCDPALDALDERALDASGAEAERLWTRVYARLEEIAPGVPLVNRRSMTLVSRRVGNFQHHPMWGTLLDQLWVR
jgi:peptide/nickel transport system substrate-binding protein